MPWEQWALARDSRRLTDASFAQEPSSDADQKHGNDGRGVSEVTHYINHLAIVVLSTVTLSSSVMRLDLSIGLVIVLVIVGVVWRLRFHHNLCV